MILTCFVVHCVLFFHSISSMSFECVNICCLPCSVTSLTEWFIDVVALFVILLCDQTRVRVSTCRQCAWNWMTCFISVMRCCFENVLCSTGSSSYKCAPWVISRRNAWNGVPVVKVFKNTLSTALRTFFPVKNALDYTYRILHIKSQHFSGGWYPKSPQKRPRCLDPDTDFRLARHAVFPLLRFYETTTDEHSACWYQQMFVFFAVTNLEVWLIKSN